MKKRVLALLLAVIMIVSLLPVTALAADPIEMVCERAHFYSDEESYSVQLSDDDISKGMKFSFDTSDKSFEVGKTYTLGEMDQSNTFMSDYSGNWYRFSNCDYKESADQYGNITIEANATLQSGDVYHITYVGYAITNGTTQDENGSISVDNLHAAENETVTVTVTPNKGYQIKTLKYNDGEDHEITADDKGAYKFTMPAKAVTVTAEFEEKPTYTYEVSFPEGPEQVYIIGDASNWENFLPMTMISKTTATITVDTQFTGYKYTAGDAWKYVERDAQGSDISNRTTYADPDVVESWADVPPQYKYTEYENWQLKHEGSGWEWTENLVKVEDGLFMLEYADWTGSGFNVGSDANPIKKDWFAPEELKLGEEVIAPVSVDVYLRVIDDKTVEIGVGVKPAAPAPVFDACGGTGAKWNSDAKTVSNPTFGDYVFAGWYTAPVGGDKIESGFTARTTYYAHWTNAEGKTVLTQPITVKSDGIYLDGKLMDSTALAQYGIGFTPDTTNGEPTLTLTNAAIMAEPIQTAEKYFDKPSRAAVVADSSVKRLKINATDSAIGVIPGEYPDEAVYAIAADNQKLDLSGSELTVDVSGVSAKLTAAIMGGPELTCAASAKVILKNGTGSTESEGIMMPGTLSMDAAELTVTGGKGSKGGKVFGISAAKLLMENGSVLTATKDASVSASDYEAIHTRQVYDPDLIVKDSTIKAGGKISAKTISFEGKSSLTADGAVAANVTPDTAAVINGTKAESPAKGYTQTDKTQPIVVCLAPVFDLGNGKTILGEAGELPAEPTWDGYTFEGWFAPGATEPVTADAVADGVIYTAKWTNPKTGKTVLTKDMQIKEDGIYLGGAKTDNTALAQYGVKYIEAAGSEPATIELDSATIAPKLQTENEIYGATAKVRAAIFSNRCTWKIDTKSESSIIIRAGEKETANALYSDHADLTISGETLNIIMDGGAVADNSLTAINTRNPYGPAVNVTVTGKLNIELKNGKSLTGIDADKQTILNSEFTVKATNASTANALLCRGDGQGITIGGTSVVDMFVDQCKVLAYALNVYCDTVIGDDAKVTLFCRDSRHQNETVSALEDVTLKGNARLISDGDVHTLEKFTMEDNAFVSVLGNMSCKVYGPADMTVLNSLYEINSERGMYRKDATKPILIGYFPVFDAGNGNLIAGEEGKLPEETPVWNGYKFGGWYTDVSYSTAAKAEDVKNGVTFYAKWTNPKTGKLVLAQEMEVKADGVYLNGTPADSKTLAQYGIKFTAGEPAVLELDGAVIAPKLKSVAKELTKSEIYAAVTLACPTKINVKSESSISVRDYTPKTGSTKAETICCIFANDCDVTVSGKKLNIAADGALGAANAYGIDQRGDENAITVDGILDAKASNAYDSNYALLGQNIHITGDAVVTARAESEYGNYANAINPDPDTGETGLTISGNAVVNAYGGKGYDEYYGIWTNGSILVKDTATLNLYGGTDLDDGSVKEALFLEGEGLTLTVQDSAKFYADSTIKASNGCKFDFKDQAYAEINGDVRAYVEPNANCTNGIGDYESAEGFARNNKNLPIRFSAAMRQVNLDGVLTGYCFTAGLIQKPEDPVKEGFRFGGWFRDKACTQAWNFDADVPSEDTTLYPLWIKVDTAVENNEMKLIAGSELGSEGDNNAALIEVYDGEKLIKALLTDEDGNYDLGYLAPGDYELRITANGRSVSELLHVEEGYNSAPVSLIGGIGTEVEIVESGSDTPHVIVGGLSKLAENYKDGDRSDLAFIVEAQTASVVSVDAKAAISDLPETEGKQVSFVDMSIFREYIGGDKDGERDPIHDTGYVMEIVMDYDTSNRKDIQVFRYHDDGENEPETIAFTELEERPSNAADYVDGTYYVGNGFLVIYTQYFSEYAIGYTTARRSGGSGGGAAAINTVTAADTVHGTVTMDKKSASAGATVTVTVVPDKGFTLETITVTDANGNAIEVKNIGNGQFTFVMPATAITVSATFMEDNSMLNFCVDVKATDYFYDAVLWAYTNKICNGVDSVHFGPDASTTRAQMVTFLWRAAGCPEPNGDASAFTDLKLGDYYEKAVAWAVEKGITKGTSATTFSPDENVSRAQAVTFLARLSGVTDDAAGYTHGFTDVKDTDYFSNAVAWAATNNITSGTSATTFSPDDDCLRSQIVTFLYRYYVKA